MSEASIPDVIYAGPITSPGQSNGTYCIKPILDYRAYVPATRITDLKAQLARAEKAEALLNRAVEALHYIVKQWPDDFAARTARATLAAIKEAQNG